MNGHIVFVYTQQLFPYLGQARRKSFVRPRRFPSTAVVTGDGGETAVCSFATGDIHNAAAKASDAGRWSRADGKYDT